ncbi:MAG: hypothetical protein MUE52_19695 [Tabrizicola sp.]|nr:hypothetical protein [Tabrizicola sp.]
MENAALMFAVAALAGMIPALFVWASRGKSTSASAEAQRIKLSKNYVWLGTAFCLGFIGFSLYGISRDPTFIAAWILLVMFLGTIFALFSGRSAEFDIIWDTEKVTGPRSVMLPPLGKTRNTIYWSDVAELKQKGRDAWRISDGNGKQVSWSRYYSGWEDLHQEIKRQRPDLAGILETH